MSMKPEIAFAQVFPSRPDDGSADVWFPDDPAWEEAILFPQDSVLDPPTFRSLRRAVTKRYDETFYFTYLLEAPEGLPAFWRSNWDEGPVSEVEGFAIMRNAIFSPSGRWGIFFSDGDHALIGGEHAFLSDVASGLVEPFDLQQRQLIEDDFAVFGDPPPRYLFPLIARLDGDEAARQQLQKAGFTLADSG